MTRTESDAANPQGEVPSRYRVHLLPRAKPTERGILYLRGDAQFLLSWSRVKRAFAARVGEPEHETVVFDLAVSWSGPECVVCRLEVAPGAAPQVAQAIALGVAPAAQTAGLRAIAHAGRGALAFPDVETFSDAALESIRYTRC